MLLKFALVANNELITLKFEIFSYLTMRLVYLQTPMMSRVLKEKVLYQWLLHLPTQLLV